MRSTRACHFPRHGEVVEINRFSFRQWGNALHPKTIHFQLRWKRKLAQKHHDAEAEKARAENIDNERKDELLGHRLAQKLVVRFAQDTL